MPRKRTPQDFSFKERLGHGSYSTVYKAVDRSTGQLFAIKVCSKKHIISENKVKYVTIEKNTMNLLAHGNHPGIIKLYYTFHDTENLYFVLDFAPGGELLQLLQAQGRFNEAWTKHLLCQLVDALQYIHGCKVVHRDLKPENLLLSSEGRLMITDFGVASNLNPTDDLLSTSSFVGTAEYVSPELLLQNKSSYCSDVWAVGCMLYQFTQGTPPFRGENELAAFEKIVNLEYHWIYSVPQPIVDLVSKILVLDPASRYTLPQIMKHAWFEGVDWENKDLIWKGVWQLFGKRNPNSSSSSSIMNKQLHVIDISIKNIPIQPRKRKPMKVTQTTSSIVEWRKNLGLSPVSGSVGVNGLPKPSKPHLPTRSNPNSPSRAQATKHYPKSIPANVPPTEPPKLPVTPVSPWDNIQPCSPVMLPAKKPASVSNGKRPLTPPASPKILKQSWVKILEIPYVPSSKKIFSHSEYSFIDNKLITKFISSEKSYIASDSLLALLTLEPTGQFSYTPKGASTRHMISIVDQDLSIYDLEFNEAKKSGYLIFEKFKSKLWFIALPKEASNDSVINSKQPWIDSLFKTKSTLESEKLSKKVDNLSLKTAELSSPSTSKPRKSLQDQMFVSSSRAEVLYSLNKQKRGNTDAANGASAAFKNMYK
ncbi:unnamed protein product [Kluyveromyces dobzhanskii CBS 2104]|uniref:non-specific serine/threonine protein kinase n=1 Tax=Kluyveromyces dobzhanskii CBS 2104 TaxID=1427455 RepID=A0A0A8L7R8_9SACH|nr:unnamed protein product [Kluyveromyces dobzhanskii CBS 2104]